jgi:hypothetical protein
MKKNIFKIAQTLMLAGSVCVVSCNNDDGETKPEATTVETSAAVSNVTQTSFTASGEVLTGNPSARGIAYGTSANPTVSGTKVAAAEGGKGTFSVNITGLEPAVKYYIRAYATTGSETVYGTQREQTTSATVAANLVIDKKTSFSAAAFLGDSIPFTIGVSSDASTLANLTVELFYAAEQVSQTVIGTPANGDYSGKIYVPYITGNPSALVRLTLADNEGGIVDEDVNLPLSIPDFPSLIFVSNGVDYPMAKTASNQYAVTAAFPAKSTPGYFKAAAVGANGNELTWGKSGDDIVVGSTTDLSFAEALEKHTITFNTSTYATTSYSVIHAADLTPIDDAHYKIDLNLTAGNKFVVRDVPNFETFWIDPDWFTKTDSILSFNAIAGQYRITADLTLSYLRVETLDGSGNYASLQADGSGAVWLGGAGFGKPNVTSGNPNWSWGDAAICLAPYEPKKYKISFKVGETTTADGEVFFKFSTVRDCDWSDDQTFNNTANIDVEGNVWINSNNVQHYEPWEAGSVYTLYFELTDYASTGRARAVFVKSE